MVLIFLAILLVLLKFFAGQVPHLWQLEQFAIDQIGLIKWVLVSAGLLYLIHTHVIPALQKSGKAKARRNYKIVITGGYGLIVCNFLDDVIRFFSPSQDEIWNGLGMSLSRLSHDGTLLIPKGHYWVGPACYVAELGLMFVLILTLFFLFTDADIKDNADDPQESASDLKDSE